MYSTSSSIRCSCGKSTSNLLVFLHYSKLAQLGTVRLQVGGR